jgi:hypothetical protein
MCHSGSNAPEKVRLTSYEDIMEGGEHGEIIVPGKPKQSHLVEAIRGIIKPRMPLNNPPLPEQYIEKIESWIKECAQNRKFFRRTY